MRTTASGTIVLLVLTTAAWSQGLSSQAKAETIQLTADQTSYVAGENFEITVQTLDGQGRPVARVLLLSVFEKSGVEGTGRIVQKGEISTRDRDGLARVALSLERPGAYAIQGVSKADQNVVSQALSLQIVPARILDDRVDQVLREWSNRAKGIQSLWAEFDRTVVDKVWNETTTNTGSACYLAPNRARLDIVDVESYIVNGKGEIWEYKVKPKQIKVYHLPKEMIQNQDLQDGPLPFLFGTDPDRAKARYNFKIGAEDDKSLHLVIKPKLQEDLQNFVRAEVWLNKEKFLPDKLYFLEPNRKEITFTFTFIKTNIEIDPEKYFTCRQFPDWRIVHQNVESPKDSPAMQR